MKNMIRKTNNASKKIDKTTRDLFSSNFTDYNDSPHINIINMQSKVKDAILQQNPRKQKLLKKLYYLYYKNKF